MAVPARMKPSSAEMPVLDAIDRRILSELQANGRITNVELARRAGISAPPACAGCAGWRKRA